MKCEECGFEFHRLRCTGCGTPIGDRILMDTNDPKKAILNLFGMIEAIHSDVESIKKQLKGKDTPIGEEVRRAATLNRLYTDMDRYRKILRGFAAEHDIDRLNRWCYDVENVLADMGIGVIRS